MMLKDERPPGTVYIHSKVILGRTGAGTGLTVLCPPSSVILCAIKCRYLCKPLYAGVNLPQLLAELRRPETGSAVVAYSMNKGRGRQAPGNSSV